MTWTLAPGAVGHIGEVGSLERRKLDKQLGQLQQRLHTVKVRVPRLAPAAPRLVPAATVTPRVIAKPTTPRVTAKPTTRRVTSVPVLPRGGAVLSSPTAEVDRIVRDELAKHPTAWTEWMRLASTYRAPAKVSRPTTVLVTGTAQDGTGRTVSARIQVSP